MSVGRKWMGLWVALIACQAWAGRPFLWRVEDGVSKPSYLFGSIHIPVPAVTNLAPSVERAFCESDAVYCELAFDEATILAISQAAMSAKRPLSSVLPPALYARAESEIRRIVPAMSLSLLDRAEVWVLMSQLVMLEYQLKYPDVPPLDLLFYRRATSAGKEAGGLESAQEQLAAMNAFTVDEQVEMLRAALDDMADLRKKGQDPVRQLLDAYLSGDTATVDREVERAYDTCSPALQQRFEKLLLSDRNRTMAERIRAKIKAAPLKSHFFVVGALHGLGEGSVVDLLRQSGAKVVRVAE